MSFGHGGGGGMLSAVTTMVTVVPVSELTDLAVVDISKSNVHVPVLSNWTALGSDPNCIWPAVCP
jgi:hypothetical protein